MYDAFISYNSSDNKFVKILAGVLEKYKPPRSFKHRHRKHLAIFYYEGKMTLTELNKAIRKHLSDSAKLIVICSPSAKESEFVNKEIEIFAEENDTQNIIPVLVEGLPDNEVRTKEDENKKAFPEGLLKVSEVPLAKDYRHFRPGRDKVNKGKFKVEWYKLLADILDKSVDIVTRIEERRLRIRILSRATVSVMILALIWLGIVIITENAANRLAAQAKHLLSTNPTQAMWMAAEAKRVSPDNQSANQVFHDIVSNRQKRPFYQCVLNEELGGIQSANFSSDESLILTTSNNGLVRVWAHDGELISTIEVDNDIVLNAKFSKDNKYIIASGINGTATLWSLDGILEKTFKCHDYPIEMIYFTKDNTVIFGSYLAGSVQRWDLDGQLINEQRIPFKLFEGLDDSKIQITDFTFQRSYTIGNRTFESSELTEAILAIDIEGNYAITKDHTNNAHLWTWNDKLESLKIDPSHLANRRTVSFSYDSQYFLTAGFNVVKVFSIDGENILSVESPEGDAVTATAFSADGRFFAAAMEPTHTIYVWNLAGELLASLDGHISLVNSIQFSTDNNILLSAGSDSQALIWRLQDGEQKIFQNNGEVNYSVFSPDGEFILTSSDERELTLWDTNGVPAVTWSLDWIVASSGTISPDSRWLAAGLWDGTIWVKELFGGTSNRFQAHSEMVPSVKYSPDGQYLLSVGADAICGLWSVPEGYRKWSYTVPNGIACATISKEGNILVGTFDGRVHVLDLNCNFINELKAHQNNKYISVVECSPSNEFILTAGAENKVKLWDWNGNLIYFFDEFNSAITSATFSPDGQYVVAGSKDGMIKVWTIDGRLIQTFDQHKGWIKSIAFSPDSKYVLSTGEDDGQAILWPAVVNEETLLRSGQIAKPDLALLESEIGPIEKAIIFVRNVIY